MDTKDLIKKLRDHDLHYSEQEAAADALERLTQPVGEVEPACFAHQGEIDYVKAGGHTGAFYLENPDSDPEFVALYSAATVARLVAERDAAQTSRDFLFHKSECLQMDRRSQDKRINALQDQVKMLRDALELAASYLETTSDNLIDKALAATEPKEGEKS